MNSSSVQSRAAKAARRQSRRSAARASAPVRAAQLAYAGPMPRNSSSAQRRQFRQTGQMESAPVAIARLRRQRAPVIRMEGSGEVMRVTHREYVAEVDGSTAWATTSYPIQPALGNLFVWLSSIAANFEKYRFRRLRFCYETESPTSQAGSIVFAIDYDALDSAPASKQAALSYKSSVRSAPWAEFTLECDLSSDAQATKLWTRSGDVPSGADQRLYDVGNLFVGTQKSSGSTGELWVEYDVELHTPQAPNPPGAKITGATSLTASALFGSDAAYSSKSQIGWSITSSSVLTCNVAGTYLFDVYMAGSSLVGTGFGSSSSATVSSNLSVNAAGTAATGRGIVTAVVGDTFAPVITSGTVSGVTWFAARFRVVA